MLAFMWFFISTYVWYRGVCLVFLEMLENCWTLWGHSHDRLAPAASVSFKIHSLKGVFKYVYRLVQVSKKPSFPTVVIEGTYVPKHSFQNAGISIRGEICDRDRLKILKVVEKYLSSHKASPHVSWLKVIAFKGHFVYESVFYQLHELCQEQGGLFIGTVTNDPFAAPYMACIGLDDSMFQESKKVTRMIPRLTVESF